MSSFKRITLRASAAVAGALMLAGHGFALDPVTDPMRPYGGPTAGAPSEAFRGFQRDVERAPSLSERFGLPRISGPLPPILPPVPTQPVFDTPENAWPPPVERARRRPADRDG